MGKVFVFKNGSAVKLDEISFIRKTYESGCNKILIYFKNHSGVAIEYVDDEERKFFVETYVTQIEKSCDSKPMRL